MQGIIGVRGLRIRCIVGVLPHERVNEQDLIVDIRVRTDFSACIASDRLEDTVDYVRIAALATTFAVEGKYQLIECYAGAVVERLLADYPISWAWIKIEKPAAIPQAECSVVEFEKGK